MIPQNALPSTPLSHINASRAPLLYLELGWKVKYKTRSTWMVDSGSVWARTLRCVPSKIFPWKRRGLAVLLWELPCTTTSFFDAQTQEPTEPFYGRKKPNGLYLRRKYWAPWKEPQHLQNGPRKQSFSIGVLEVGSKERQTRDSCLGAEEGTGNGTDQIVDMVKG